MNETDAEDYKYYNSRLVCPKSRKKYNKKYMGHSNKYTLYVYGKHYSSVLALKGQWNSGILILDQKPFKSL